MTDRQRAAFRLYLQGDSTRQAAAKLGISQPTVCRDIGRLCEHYPGLRPSLELVRAVNRMAARNGD